MTSSSDRAAHPLSKRAREWAFRLLYAGHLNGKPAPDLLADMEAHFLLSEADWEALAPSSPYLPDPRRACEREPVWEPVRDDVADAVAGVLENLGAIEDAIQAASPRWRLDRMPPVDRVLLCLGCYELVVRGSRPARRVINRTVELAKRYGELDSRRFVNGILDQIRKDHGIRAD